MKARDYFALPGVSSHMLIEMMRSPLHCWANYLGPERSPEESTPAQRQGTLVHTLMLTPETFGDDHLLLESINRRTEAGKAELAAASKAGKSVVSRVEYRAALAVVKALRQHPDARPELQSGEPEKVIVVPRGTILLPLKGRLDWLGTPPRVVELKTAADARKGRFLSDVYRYGYHPSAAYYRMLAGEHTGAPAQAIPHTFVVAETKPPYAVAGLGGVAGTVASAMARLAMVDATAFRDHARSLAALGLRPRRSVARFKGRQESGFHRRR